MDSVEEECQARRAKDRAQHHIDNPNHYHYHLHPLLQNISPALVQNRGRRERYYLPLLHIIPNNLPHHPSLQNIPPASIWNRERGGRRYITPLYVLANLDEAIADLHRRQQANQVQVEPIAQINEMVIEQRNKGNDALDYDEQQANKDGNQNVDRVIEENLGRAQIVVSNRY